MRKSARSFFWLTKKKGLIRTCKVGNADAMSSFMSYLASQGPPVISLVIHLVEESVIRLVA